MPGRPDGDVADFDVIGLPKAVAAPSGSGIFWAGAHRYELPLTADQMIPDTYLTSQI